MILHSQTLVRDGREDYDGTKPAYMAHSPVEIASGPNYPTQKQRRSDKSSSVLKRPSVHNATTRFTDHRTRLGDTPIWIGGR